MTTATNTPSIILIAGHWLGAWAWDEVLEHLKNDHPDASALTLPGLDANDPERATRTLEDQCAAILQVISHQGDRPVLLVAHSGANAPVSMVMDRHPELVHRVVWVDSGPVAPGSVFAPDLPEEVQELVLPPFEVLGQQAQASMGSAQRFSNAFGLLRSPNPARCCVRASNSRTDPATRSALPWCAVQSRANR